MRDLTRFKTRRRYLAPGSVTGAAIATVAIAAARALHVLIPTWWAVSLPAAIITCAYTAARLDAKLTEHPSPRPTDDQDQD